MATVSVRYIVEDLDAAIAFYTRHLGFPARGLPFFSRNARRLAASDREPDP